MLDSNPRRALALAGLLCGLIYFTTVMLGLDDGPALALKPWPVLALAALAVRETLTSRLVALGLVLSAIGDVALELSFLAGMAAFALAHVAYIGAFVAERPPLRPILAVPFAVWVAGLFLAVRSELGPLEIPVAAYACVIGVMMWRAVARGEPLVAVGAIVFGVSDSTLALRLGHTTFPGQAAVILLTYWAGQALIAAGGRSETA